MRSLILLFAGALAITSVSAEAKPLFGRAAASPSGVVSEAKIAEVKRAIDEQRLLDAGRLLDEQTIAGVKDPRLALLGGDLNLARKRYAAALSNYKLAEAAPSTQARSLQGQGLALSLLSRSTEAVAVLERAVAADPKSWRAWNALGAEYDARSRWTDADAAYQHAFAASDGAAQVLNNRGYSRLLQRRRDEAVSDFVAALQKKPDLAEARTNLRLALAMGGDYERAIAGVTSSDQAALLNNAGFAAGMRGDYAKAEELLGRAVTARGEYYARASENLKIVRALASRSNEAPHAGP
jgi:Flp pilus assembly protein TadD